MLKLFNQQNRVTCAACSYATVLSGFGINITEREACDDCHTDKRGTFDSSVLRALRKRGIDANIAYLNIDFDSYSRWLYLNSINRFLYVSMFGQNQGKRGAPTKEHHAIAINNGMVYDSAYPEVIPLETYTFKYNKKFLIELIILVDNPNPQKFLSKGLDL